MTRKRSVTARVVEQVTILPAVGAGRMQAEQRDAAAGLLDEDAVARRPRSRPKNSGRRSARAQCIAALPSRASRSSCGAAPARSASRRACRLRARIRAPASAWRRNRGTAAADSGSGTCARPRPVPKAKQRAHVEARATRRCRQASLSRPQRVAAFAESQREGRREPVADHRSSGSAFTRSR